MCRKSAEKSSFSSRQHVTQSPPGPCIQEHVTVHRGIFGPKGMLGFAPRFFKTKICGKSALRYTSFYFIVYHIMSWHVQTKMWMQLICWGRAGGGCWTNPPLECKKKVSMPCQYSWMLATLFWRDEVAQWNRVLHSDTKYYNELNYITQPESTPQPRTNATGKMVCSNSR